MTGRSPPPPRHGGDTSRQRATTITLNYVLVLGISTLLVTGLIIAGGAFVEDQRENVIRGEMNVIGTHVAGNLEQVDRYVGAAEGNPSAHVNQTFQRQVSGESYDVRLEANPGGPAQIVLSANTADVTVTVNASVSTGVETSSARGGTISVYYDGSDLVIDNA